jgi:hypothetical protein
MYTGTVIEDLIQCVEKVEQRAQATAYQAVDLAPPTPSPLAQPAYELNWQDWQEMVEVA